ncbi:MAG: flavodoxin-dependent (E)-4-hydroxy-3-methylbut-2-enyl-diphosphate synthase [Candidatus Micrarchaeota archaeon]|nr:flavodoxin-dependent (E)-4-hydroxy-3-methylbut-2-enyl-diphosphate synthase [Candidatus Micrarchaeota archaeon]
MIPLPKRRKTFQVKVGNIFIGSEHPIVVQSMTNTNTADVDATVKQIIELHDAGSEIVRFTVKDEEMAKAVPEIRKKLKEKGYDVPLVGDFHYNGDILLSNYPKMADSLDKWRVNPGNAGSDERFRKIIKLAIDYNKPIRIGVNGGSLDQKLLAKMIDEDLKKPKNKQLGAHHVFLNAMVKSALTSAESAIEYGMPEDKIIISAKVSDVRDLIYVYSTLAKKCKFPLHLGLTEAGGGSKGIVASAQGIGILLNQGIGDTIRVSITPRPGQSRTEEVRVAQEILQTLGLRAFFPMVTSCPGCGRTTSTVFQTIAEEISRYLQEMSPVWRAQGYKGFERMKVAVMGCIVNGPGESREANIGLSLPGSGETPSAPVFADGKQIATLTGDAKKISEEYKKLINEYVVTHYKR